MIQFAFETEDFVVPSEVRRADFITFDGRVVPAQVTLMDGIVDCLRQQSDSCKLRLLCRVGDQEIVLQTTSLRERPEPYRLEVELARGELSRLRNFFAMWSTAGLKSGPDLDQAISQAQASFRNAVFSASSATAIQCLEQTGSAVNMLVDNYTAQRITFRKMRTQHFPMSVGCRLTRPPVEEQEFLNTFSSVLVKTRWRELEPRDGEYQWEELDALVEWATSRRLFTIGGPLLDLTSNCFPDWMMAWRGDMVNLQSFTSDFVETVVSRYVGRIRHWEVVCGANRGGVNLLTEEQRLNLVARAVEAAEAVDEQIQISVRVMQPWGEYLSETSNRLSPIQFVDALRRCGVKISEVNVDLRFGNGELDSLPRDMLGVSQLLDHWSVLQLPMNVMAALPEGPLFNDKTVSPEARTAWQTRVMKQLFTMCLSKERVTGFYCLNWSDSTVADGRLADDAGNIHPVVSQLAALEEQYWPSE